jgi:hypothetical protein
MLARQQARQSGAPADARRALEDLLVEFLGIFYQIDNEPVSEGLAELWEKALPYMSGGASRSSALTDLDLRDEDLATWAHYAGEMASLTAQREAIKSASDYELMRARRLVLFCFRVSAPHSARGGMP